MGHGGKQVLGSWGVYAVEGDKYVTSIHRISVCPIHMEIFTI